MILIQHDNYIKDGMATIIYINHPQVHSMPFQMNDLSYIIIQIVKGFISSTSPFLMNEENRFEFVIPTVKCNC